MMNLIKAEGVRLGHKQKFIHTTSLSFEIPQVAMIGLIGRNGAGKTTFLESLIGEKRLLAGRIRVGAQQKDVSTFSVGELSKTVAFVPQEHEYASFFSVDYFLSLGFLPENGLRKSLSQAQIDQLNRLKESFELGSFSNSSLSLLSSGERQRALVARALLQKTEILLLDEPTTHLDPGACSRFWELLAKSVKAAGTSAIISTHDIRFIENECDWILALGKTGLLFCGTRENFLKSAVRDSLYLN